MAAVADVAGWNRAAKMRIFASGYRGLFTWHNMYIDWVVKGQL